MQFSKKDFFSKKQSSFKHFEIADMPSKIKNPENKIKINFNLPCKNLKFTLDHYLPNPKINFLNYLRSKFLQTDLRLNLLNMVSKGKFEINNEISEGLRIYKRNISFLLDICVSKKIERSSELCIS